MINIIYEDNHLLVLNKACGDLVQGDQTGDQTLADKAKEYLKLKYNKPGNVFLGIPHRLDRPTSGIVVYTKTGKALQRMTGLFKNKEIKKIYHAVCVGEVPQKQMQLSNFLIKNKSQNKSYVTSSNTTGARKAVLNFELKGKFQKYSFLEIELITGRHHQIRVQLQNIGLLIKGDLKYGYPTPNDDAGIHLHAHRIEFIHPVKKTPMTLSAEHPKDALWDKFQK